MSQSQRIARAVVNYGLGSYAPQIVNFVLVPVYTHFLVPAEMGQLEIYLTMQVLVAILMRLGMNGSITRFYFDHREGDRLKDMVTTIAFAVVACSALILGLMLLVGPWLFRQIMPEIPFSPYMEIALVAAFFQAAPDIQSRLLEAREKSAQYAKLVAFFGILTTAVTAVSVIHFRAGVAGILWSNLATAVLYAVVAYVLNRKDLQGKLNWGDFRQGLAYGLPLVPHHAAAWAQQFVGRWVLAAVGTAAMVGELSVAAKVASPIAIASGAFARAYSPVYFSWCSTGGKDLALAESRKLANLVLLAGGILVIGADIFGGMLVRYAMSEEYLHAADLIVFIATALFFQILYSLVVVELFYEKTTKLVSVIFIVSSIANALAVLWLVPLFGATGAALGQCVGALSALALVHLHTLKTIRSPLQPATLLLWAVWLCLVGFVNREYVVSTVSADVAKRGLVFLVGTAGLVVLTRSHSAVFQKVAELRARRRSK